MGIVGKGCVADTVDGEKQGWLDVIPRLASGWREKSDDDDEMVGAEGATRGDGC